MCNYYANVMHTTKNCLDLKKNVSHYVFKRFTKAKHIFIKMFKNI